MLVSPFRTIPVAGEAGVPFFSVSGSEFAEMFVGLGATRVGELLTRRQAQLRAIALRLLEKEVLEGDGLRKLLGDRQGVWSGGGIPCEAIGRRLPG